MNKDVIFFDANSTTIISNAAKNAMASLDDAPYNPSAVHSYGRVARKLLEDSKKNILSALKLDNDYKITFTGSGTEANNMVFAGLAGYEALIGATEHMSVIKPAEKYCNSHIINVDINGNINLEDLENKLISLSDKKIIISIMYANNETGVIQDLTKIIPIVKKYNALFHTDAIQVIGKCEFDFAGLDADIITLSAHKFGGTAGVGAIIYKSNLNLTAMIVGGGQEMGLRSGTQNVIGAVGFSAALCYTILDNHMKNIVNIRNYIEKEIKLIAGNAIIVANENNRLINTSMIIMPNITNEVQLMRFDMAGIAVSTGSACSSGKMSKSHVLNAMGLAQDLVACALRVSLPRNATINHADKFIKIWKEIYEQGK
jgi:cysteine desulfurase